MGQPVYMLMPKGSGLDKRQASIQAAIRAEGEQVVRPMLIVRGEGLRVAFDLQGRSMKAQMREANRHSAAIVVIVGEDELAKKAAVVRRMETGEQQEVPFDELLVALR